MWPTPGYMEGYQWVPRPIAKAQEDWAMFNYENLKGRAHNIRDDIGRALQEGYDSDEWLAAQTAVLVSMERQLAEVTIADGQHGPGCLCEESCGPRS